MIIQRQVIILGLELKNNFSVGPRHCGSAGLRVSVKVANGGNTL